jgi:hypothetical protein
MESFTYLYIVMNETKQKQTRSKLPNHRQLLIEAFGLAMAGNQKETKKTLKKADIEINKFYNIK